VYVALPLDKLFTGGDKIKAGDTIHLNIVRAKLGGLDGSAMWIPTLTQSFHTPDRLGEIVLE